MEIVHRGIPRREPALPTQHRPATHKPPLHAIPRTLGLALQDPPPKLLARKGPEQRSNPERAATTQCLHRPDRGAMPPESWCNAARIVVQCRQNRGAMSPDFAGGGAGREVQPALHQGRDRGGAVLPAPGPLHQPRHGVLRHHLALLPRRGRDRPGPAWQEQGFSPTMQAIGCWHGARRGRGSRCLGNLAGEHRRRQDPGPGRRAAAGAIRAPFHLRRRGPWHDQPRDPRVDRSARVDASFSARGTATARRSRRKC